jgi:hypothetical protein
VSGQIKLRRIGGWKKIAPTPSSARRPRKRTDDKLEEAR